jgi:hypothetical protein
MRCQCLGGQGEGEWSHLKTRAEQHTMFTQSHEEEMDYYLRHFTLLRCVNHALLPVNRIYRTDGTGEVPSAGLAFPQ